MSSITGYTFPANAPASMVDLEASTAMDARENAGAAASVSTPFKQGSGAYDGGGETTAGGLSALLQHQPQHQQQDVHNMRSPLTASPAEPGSAFWQKRGMHTSPVSVLMIPALNLSIETTMDDMDCDDDEKQTPATPLDQGNGFRISSLPSLSDTGNGSGDGVGEFSGINGGGANGLKSLKTRTAGVTGWEGNGGDSGNSTPRASNAILQTPRSSYLDLSRLPEAEGDAFEREGFTGGAFGFGVSGFQNHLPPTPARPQFQGKLARFDSLKDTKLLVSTHLARCSSGPMTSPVDFQFQDHFDFIKPIGRSPTSEVWLVKSKASDTKYCVKKVIAKFNNMSERTRYIHEVEAVTFLPAHPHVVKYFRAWQENQQFFCQMELCECGSFGGCLERLPPNSLVDERDVWVLTAQVSAGLTHIHSYGILHLDIKPDNIFLDRHGTYKIGDFGVAWVAGKGWELQDGDGGYVAPEVLAMNLQALPTPAADVFSFGATLYEAAAGQPLPRELRQGLPSCSSPQGEHFVVDLPEGRSRELAVLISMCLKRNPLHRPSAAEIDERAQAVLRGL